MKRTLIASLFAVVLASQIAHAEPKPKKVQQIEDPAALTPSTSRPNEFQGDDISFVLRTLAHQARMNVVIDNNITGTVTLRVLDKTPRETIEIIAQSKELLLEEHKGIFYLRPKNPPPIPAEAVKPEKSFEEALTEMLTPAIAKVYDSILDYHARPEIAQKVAKSKKLLYDALIAEGFTKEEAFRLVLADQGIPIPDHNK